MLSKYFTKYWDRSGFVYLYYYVIKCSNGLYGVMVKKFTLNSVSEFSVVSESKISEGISKDRKIVNIIARILCKNSVTPCVIDEVIDDIILPQITYIDYQENRFVG